MKLNCELFLFDCTHSYTDAVLDIGSGLGGPARYMATKTGCRVTAVEIQEDLHQTASDLTNRCGLSHLITHLFGNFIYMQEGKYKNHL